MAFRGELKELAKAFDSQMEKDTFKGSIEILFSCFEMIFGKNTTLYRNRFVCHFGVRSLINILRMVDPSLLEVARRSIATHMDIVKRANEDFYLWLCRGIVVSSEEELYIYKNTHDECTLGEESESDMIARMISNLQ
jgi:hypothetical protein